MLKLTTNPTFKTKVGIPVPGGKAVPITLEFRAKTRAELTQWLEDNKETPVFELVRGIVCGWADVDEPFSEQSLEKLLDVYPGAAIVIFNRYAEEHSNGKSGN